ncbi:MAG TPA: 50S ribosomal protein L3 N(5)-glutamine methyltransferase [Aliidiomarina sp.]|nr:50S ribosomal protein L3 N(5)-glutamine methyltransferase [Aliidiomarina sp.]
MKAENKQMNDDQKKLGDGLKTIGDWQRYIATQLHQAEIWFGHGAVDGWDEANLLLSELTQLHHAELGNYLSCRLAKHEREQLAAWLEQRLEDRVPAAYLVNKAWFAGLPFYVDERVLVPRSPIAELIENNFAPWLTKTPEQILDLCTGSACIAIACAYAFPDAIVHASDISADALEVAEINVSDHDLEERVALFQSDGFSRLPETKYDLIVTNPPYVDAEDMADLPEEYRHEPELGLAAGNDGLDLVRDILLHSPDYLTEEGMLICEVGNSWVHMAELWPEVPFVWLSFEHGGDGVFAINRSALVAARACFE